MHFFLEIFLIILIIELILRILVNILKKNFQWIITSEREFPNLENNKLKKFYQKTFDQICGWDRRKNTFGHEISKNNKKTKFTINAGGYRGPLKTPNSKISVFGDSFAFCRFMNDNQTWEYFLQKKIRKGVLNFGVGNFGLDQSYLKYKKFEKKIKTQIIIVNIVPETITRVISGWRHFSEFGNIYSFKPFFVLKGNKISLIKNPVKKYYKNKKLKLIIRKLKTNDFMYKFRLRKNIFNYFYLLTFIRNFEKYSKIIFLISLYNFFKLLKLKEYEKYYFKSLGVVINSNIKESHRLYKNYYCSKVLEKIILKFNEDVQKKGRIFILVISPQIYDLKHEFTSTYYKKFYKNLKKRVNILNLGDHLSFKNKNLYLEDKYGGHFNKSGNLHISKIIYKYLKTGNFI